MILARTHTILSRRLGGFIGLLDRFPGAAVAYSFHKLRADYTGAAIRVRESGGNTEADIGFNPDGTLDTVALLAHCGANDGFITIRYDQSGNGDDAVQTTAASQPKIVNAGAIVTDNGYDVIQYDGTDDNLGITSLTATGTMLMAGSNGSAFYAVDINGAYNLLASSNFTDYPLNETIRVIWNRSLSDAEKTAIEAIITYTNWDFSGVTDFDNFWRLRAELTSFPILDVSSGTSFAFAWRECTSLTTFPLLDVSSGDNFRFTWRDCSSLTTFPANFFDNCPAKDYTSAFTGTNLSQTSIDNILVSLDTAGQSNGAFDQSGGSAPSATGEAAIDSLRGKGWTITVTGGY